MQLALTSSHKTPTLDRGTTALLSMWQDVEFEIQDLFEQEEDLDGEIVHVQVRK